MLLFAHGILCSVVLIIYAIIYYYLIRKRFQPIDAKRRLKSSVYGCLIMVAGFSLMAIRVSLKTDGPHVAFPYLILVVGVLFYSIGFFMDA